MVARVFMGLALCSSLFVTGNCYLGTSALDAYDSMAATGGAPCYNCHSDADYCMSMNVPCTDAGGGYWYTQTFQGITQTFCNDMEKWGEMGDGQDMCMTIEYMACTTVTYCTAMDCMSGCGEPGVEEKPTMCDYTGGMACMIGS